MHRTFLALIAGLLFALGGGIASAADPCLRADGSAQTLTGRLRTIEVFGAKRYGAKPAEDAIDTLTLIALDRPACITGEDADSAKEIAGLQVTIDPARAPMLNALVGRHVVIEGAIRSAQGIEDRAAYVVTVTTIAEAPGGNPLLRVRPAELLARGRVPVRIGTRGPNVPACTGLARLAGSSPGVLRERASTAAAAVATISHDDIVHLCELTPDREWFGVVVRPQRKAKSDHCRVMTPSAQMQPYRGRCLSGWLRSDEVLIEID